MLAFGAAVLAQPMYAHAAVPVQQTRFDLPFSSGHGAGLLNLETGKLVQFREHLFAAEEPQLDEEGHEIWDGSQFAAVYTRDLLYDAYFGARVAGEQFWLPELPVDYDVSGYVGYTDETTGGTGIVAMVQHAGAIEFTTFVFSPRDIPHGAGVLALRVRNNSNQPLSDVQAFSLANFHLGYGRANSPWEVGEDIGENGETITDDGDVIRERGFAGAIATHALGPVSHKGFAPGVSVYDIVNDTLGDLPDNAPPPNAADASVAALQFDLGTIGAGQGAWTGIAFVHNPDPAGGEAAKQWIESYVGGQGAKALVDAEIAAWADFQGQLTLPEGLDDDEAMLVRHSAAMLRMGQVQEESYFLRPHVANDGDVRRTRFEPNTLPGVVQHNAQGALLARMPPGNWTYAWIRDGAYGVAGMAVLGMQQAARDGLMFYLNAESGLFKDWNELADYNMPDYQISLVRYYGFGVEETDFNDFGPNLEFDGFGLFLWALRVYEDVTGDTSVADDNWELIATEIADVIIALVEPETGLLRPDSSIWETHWNGRERHFAFTNITAARGLCDAAAIAERRGDNARATAYQEAAEALRDAIAQRLTDGNGALAVNTEELGLGEGYWDAAVLDAIAMGLFDPNGMIAQATLDGLDANLSVEAGEGWSRNDDRWDHPNAEDLSPWGSDYDSAEWVITDLRGSIAKRMAGDDARADALTNWVLDQALANFLMVAETFDENDGTYKFNTPMLGFGAGAYTLSLAHRAGMFNEPACGAYYAEEPGETSSTSDGGATDGGMTTGSTTDDSAGSTSTSGTSSETGSTSFQPGVTTAASSTSVGGTDGGLDQEPSGCGCSASASSSSPGRGVASWLAGLLLLARLRRRRVAAG